MNRLVIIGNGFDLAHGLKTRYEDFINWYWDQRRDMLLTENSKVSEDRLCRLTVESGYSSWLDFSYNNSCMKKGIPGQQQISGKELLSELQANPNYFTVEFSSLLTSILKGIKTKGWVDIEEEYYKHLKKLQQLNVSCKSLNEQLHFLQERLVKYLKTQTVRERIDDYYDDICSEISEEDISNEGKSRFLAYLTPGLRGAQKDWNPEHIMMLSFNYTPTLDFYKGSNIEHNFIHGTLDKPESIIFGFGDELDKDYKSIQEANDNELLTNVKSVRYLEAPNYRNMLRFIESAPFQVFIMGHSCGLSDRTLLNTIFEHKNCISIKPFYYQKEDGTDNYLELVQNISRNFTDMKLFRDRVVNKELCECM